MDEHPIKQWIKPKETKKLVALREALFNLDIEYAISKKDDNLVTINLWVGES